MQTSPPSNACRGSDILFTVCEKDLFEVEWQDIRYLLAFTTEMLIPTFRIEVRMCQNPLHVCWGLGWFEVLGGWHDIREVSALQNMCCIKSCIYLHVQVALNGSVICPCHCTLTANQSSLFIHTTIYPFINPSMNPSIYDLASQSFLIQPTI